MEEQMLAYIVSIENPSLEKKKIELMEKNAEDKEQLISIEDEILKTLANTTDIAQILLDESLVLQLKKSK